MVALPHWWGDRHFVRCARIVTFLEGKICSRIHVGGIGRSCDYIAHGETSWITNFFGICRGEPQQNQGYKQDS